MTVITGNDVPDTLVGTDAGDEIYGLGGNDSLSGLAGDDLLVGGPGADVLDGGSGYDLASYFTSAAGVNVSLLSGIGSGGDAQGDTLVNVDDLEGSPFNDRLKGNAGDNYLFGLAGNDQLSGDGGHDVLMGGKGADVLNGGVGQDLASYFFSTSGVAVSLSTGIGSGGEAQGDRLVSIEHLEGSKLRDSLTGNAGSNVLFGQAGNDTLNGAAGNDYLFGGLGADVIDGGAGYDMASYFYASAAVTVSLATGLGSSGEAKGDRLISIEVLDGSDFDDRLTGDAGDNYLFGNAGNDLLNGGAGNDWLYGGDGADRLNGSLGADRMYGEAGNDSYYVDNVGDVVVEQADAGIDRIVSSINTSLNFGGKLNVENLTLSGAAVTGTGNALANVVLGNGVANVLYGLDGDDTINGQKGNDRISGGSGEDVLIGGLGVDTITTGAGADTIVFRAPLGAANFDRVVDFDVALDTLLLDDAVFTGLAPGVLAAEAFATGTAAKDADDRIIYNPATGNLYFDPDGAGGAQQLLFADLATGLGVSASDFLIA